MAVTSMAYEQVTGQESSYTDEVGSQFGFGAGMQAIGLGDGARYKKAGKLLGGGWNNRFAQAGKGGVLMGLGFGPLEGEGVVKYGFMGLDHRRLGNALTADMEAYLSKQGLEPSTGVFGKARDYYKAQRYGERVNTKALWNDVLTKEFAEEAGEKGAKRVFTQSSIVKGGMKTGWKMLGPALGLGISAYSVYGAYQSGGLLGAGKQLAKEGIGWAAFDIGQTALASVGLGGLTTPLLVTAGAGLAMKKTIDYGQRHYRGLRELEIASPIADPTGIGYTMRQRSLQAIQRSSINGRMAIGNEAMLMHQTLR